MPVGWTRPAVTVAAVLAVALLAVSSLPAGGVPAGAAASHAPPSLGSVGPTGATPGPSRATVALSIPAGWTTWNQTIDWRNYSLPYFPGTRHWFSSTDNIFDTPVITDQNPSGVMTAYYVNASSQLLAESIPSGTTETLSAWPTNLSNFDSPSMLQAFQSWNGSVDVLYEMGELPTDYVWVAWYSLTNDSSYVVNTTILGTPSVSQNVNLGVWNASGWVYYTNTAMTEIDFFNIFSHQLVSLTAPALPAWNSAVYVPSAEQVVEDVDQVSNGTLLVRAFNLTAADTIAYVDRWGGSVVGADVENIPYLFRVAGGRTTLWGLGASGAGNRVLNISLDRNLSQDGSPTTAPTGSFGTTDETAAAFWDTSGYFLNGYNSHVSAAYQSAFADPLNRSEIVASNSTWFPTFFSTYNFGFGGGPWINSWHFVGPSAGWEGAILQNGTASGHSCGTVCTLLIYWLPSMTNEFGPLNRTLPPPVPRIPPPPTELTASNRTTTSVQLNWSNPAGGGLLNDTVYVALGSACGAPTTILSVGVTTEYTVAGLAGGTEYAFSVTAWNGTGQSNASACVTTQTLAAPPAPQAPTGLTVANVTPSSVALTWANPPGGGLVNDTVEVALGAACGPPTARDSVGVVTEYTVAGLADRTEYAFDVIAWNSSGPSNASTCAVATTGGPAPSATVPGAPTDVVARNVTPTTVALEWVNPGGGGLLRDTVYWVAGATCPATMRERSVGVATNWTLTGLKPGKRYAFAVTAWNATGQSNRSGCLVVATPHPLPAAPTNLTGTAEALGINWTWTESPGGGIRNNTLYLYRGAGCGTPIAAHRTRAPWKLVADVRAGATYSAEVTDWNATGQSPRSTCVTVTVPEGTTGGAGTSLFVGTAAPAAPVAAFRPVASSSAPRRPARGAGAFL